MGMQRVYVLSSEKVNIHLKVKIYVLIFIIEELDTNGTHHIERAKWEVRLNLEKDL